MSLHRAEDIAAAIKTRLLARTVALGAETNLGRVVFQGRRHISDDMIPCATLIEGTDTPAQGRLRTEYELAQHYVIFAYVPCDPANPNIAAHAAIRDIKRALFTSAGKADAQMGGQVKLIEYAGRDIGPRADGAAYVVAAVDVVVHYVEMLNQP